MPRTHYIVESAEGERASYNMSREERDVMLVGVRESARESLRELESSGVKDRIVALTHNGKFHVDEVTATAVLQKVYADQGKNIEIVRSRDSAQIADADIVYDVGGIYDPTNRRYDHHQNGALKRESGLTYSALGLIWLHYGNAYCDGNERVANRIDRVLVRGIDARDNGELDALQDNETPDYGISQEVELYNPILEHGEDYDEQFYKAVGHTAAFLARLKEKILVELRTEDDVLAARAQSEDSRYAVMDHQITPPDSLAEIDGLEYVVFPEHTNNTWQVYALKTPENQFVVKRPFPENWKGLRGEALAEITGVEDAEFCHAKRFLSVAKSREGALKLLAQALK
ncbi:MAG: MYG1 family protein [Candidatus Saccharimonas sp.]